MTHEATQAPPNSSNLPKDLASAPSMDMRLAALQGRLATATDLQVFRHTLGIEQIQSLPDIAIELANDMAVICLDLEHWSQNTDELTEIGIAHFTMDKMRGLTQPQDSQPELGDHGENAMKLVNFNGLRVKDTSHLLSDFVKTRGAAGIRFGAWRFVSIVEAKEILKVLFVQPALAEECDRPVVLLGHDVGHDMGNLKEKLKLDLDAVGTVVRIIDTQKMAKEAKCWHHRHNSIGLKKLTKRLGCKHAKRDPHTAPNDAARTMIAAFQLGLRDQPCKRGYINKTLQSVANLLESHSRKEFVSLGGDLLYCSRCTSSSHLISDCPGDHESCEVCLAAGKPDQARGHVRLHCPQAAKDRRDQRRQRDAETRGARLQAKAQKRAEALRLKRQERNPTNITSQNVQINILNQTSESTNRAGSQDHSAVGPELEIASFGTSASSQGLTSEYQNRPFAPVSQLVQSTSSQPQTQVSSSGS
ncbi:hypothetical protein NX059_011349 [Plenodomus lindquistii]|nr:hypothetical protein NX059_011349 [Plenodomus lindquistii]